MRHEGSGVPECGGHGLTGGRAERKDRQGRGKSEGRVGTG